MTWDIPHARISPTVSDPYNSTTTNANHFLCRLWRGTNLADSVIHTHYKTASAPNPNAQNPAHHAKHPNRGCRPVSFVANCPNCRSDCFLCKEHPHPNSIKPLESGYRTTTNTPATASHYQPRECCISAASPNCAKPLRSHCSRTTKSNWDDCATASLGHSPQTLRPDKTYRRQDTSSH